MQPPSTRTETRSNAAKVTLLRPLESQTSQDSVLYTTLYDLMATLHETVDPHEDHIVTATVVHLLKTRQVMCTGELQGYRLVCDLRGQIASPRQKDDLLSHYERYDSRFEKSRYDQQLSGGEA